jgi:hypothetical protein
MEDKMERKLVRIEKKMVTTQPINPWLAAVLMV